LNDRLPPELADRIGDALLAADVTGATAEAVRHALDGRETVPPDLRERTLRTMARAIVEPRRRRDGR
jgi:hypothetical protein